MDNLITHKFKQLKGIHDLMGLYAWVSTDQGDESVTNVIGGVHDRMMFVFDGIDKTDQLAIYDEVIRRTANNNLYIEELKKSGEYGKEYEVSISMVPCPLFDDVKMPPAESYRMVILDFSKTD